MLPFLPSPSWIRYAPPTRTKSSLLFSLGVLSQWLHDGTRAAPTFLSRLAQTVPDLLWKTIRSVPHSVSLVQSLLLFCTWPFPTSSSATDPSYLLAGIMIHSSLQLGLHRPLHQQDFTEYRVKLSSEEVSHRISVWIASNVVAQCVSIGVGLQTPAHLHDWATVFGPRLRFLPISPVPFMRCCRLSRSGTKSLRRLP
jgi:hypothetical protein